MSHGYEDDYDLDIPVESPKKGKGVLVTTTEKAKSSATVHPLHSVFPRDSKAGKAIAWWAAGVYTYNTSKKVYDWFENRAEQARKEKFSISIESYDEEDLYNIVFNWIIDEIDDDDPVTDYNLVTLYKRPKNIVFRTSSTSSSFNMVLCEQPVQIALDEKETKDGQVMSLKRNLVIRCKDQRSVDIISEEIAERYDTIMYERVKEEVDSGRSPRPYASWTGMGWNWKELLPRDPDSVVLHGSDKEDLFTDIDRFRSQKVEYLRTNIPWHRGYLFHGPPGTGKTSLGMAVASAYDMPIYFLPLNNVTSDADLVKAVSGIESREAVLILEDIDVVRATHNREKDSTNDKDKSVTLAGLLNVLDGVNSPSGLVTIMTTNHLTTLDPALIRPGRVDMQIEIGFLDDDQLRRLVLWYIGVEVNDFPAIESEITPAQITGIVKNNMGKPDDCVEEIRMFIKESNA